MKLIFLFLIIPLFTLSQSDIYSYGFKGKVKSVKYYIYNDCILNPESEFDPKLNSIYIEKILHFNLKGNIDSIVETLYEGKLFEKMITYNYYLNNRIKSHKKYRYYSNDILEEMKYSWSDRNQLIDFKGVGIDKKITGHRKLLYNYREGSGEYIIKNKKGVEILHETYHNDFDSYWNLTKTRYLNPTKGSYNMIYEYDKMDSVGNYQHVKLIYEETKKIQRFIIKQYEYYSE